MKILHTSDIHLRETGDERWQALRELVSIARDERADLMVVSGDLFDTKIAADRLRVPIREIFNSLPARVLILPGNHDADALSAGQYFGDRVTLMSGPESRYENDSVRVFPLPFERIDGAAVMERLLSLRAQATPDKTNIVLFHGELLDIFFDRARYGDEEDSGYMPVRLSGLDGLGIDYVLAGHFHAQFDIQSFKDGYFVYPGSPVSVTRKEQGRRKCNLFEAGQPPHERALDTFHYVTVELMFNPFDTADPVESVRAALAGCHGAASVDLVLGGFIDLGAARCTEEEFKRRLEAVADGRVMHIDHVWHDIGAALQHELYRRFERSLHSAGFETRQAAKVRRMALEAVMEVLNED